MKKSFIICMLLFTVASISAVFTQSPAAHAGQYVFPVLGKSSYSNDYNGSRPSGKHHAIDIIASKHQKIVAATDGKISHVNISGESWGNAVIIQSSGGYCYWYLHMNNDDAGTDNGKGGFMKAYAADVNEGNPVKKGQLLGYVGDSGAAETTVSHLHFSVHKLPSEGRCYTNHGEDYNTINPYNSLKLATRISKPNAYPALPGEILPFGSRYDGGINVSRGNVASSSGEEILVAAGYGGGPRISVYSSSKKLLKSFYSFDNSSRRGSDVAVGDVNGDGQQDILSTTRTGSGTKVAVYDLTSSLGVKKVSEFSVLSGSNTRSLPRVNAGDIDGDGKDEIIIGAGAGGTPQVSVYDFEGKLKKTFKPYSDGFDGGVDVASADVQGDEKDELIVSPLTSGSSRVIVYDQNYTKLRDFYAYGSSFRGGTWVDAGNVRTSTAKSEILTVPNDGGPKISYFDGSGKQLYSAYYMERWWRGTYDVAAGDGGFTTGTGKNRRGSVR